MLNKIMQEFNLKHDWCSDYDVYVCKNDNLLIQFINPHNGTDWKYCLRADFPETLDRWGVCLFEKSFEYNELDIVIGKLKKFLNDKESIVKKQKEKYPELYDEDYKN